VDGALLFVDGALEFGMHLGNSELHIWLTDLEQVPSQLIESYRQLMSPSELERNHRYRLDRSRHCDCVARALTRTVLSRYISTPPSQWAFIKGEHGKPEINQNPPPLRFNLSHSSRFVVCAVNRDCDIGIDIENTERKNNIFDIAHRYFSQQEVKDLFALPQAQQTERFFDYWTLKEAYMKARGEGIVLGLGNFSFQLHNPADIKISFNEKLDDCPDDWRFWLFSPAQDHRLALALKTEKNHPQTSLRLFQTVPLHPEVTEIKF
jgi:4'-phosphopantetheinyl transferase